MLRRGLAGVALGALLLACASRDARPPPQFSALWREFQALPDERALAIAGELRRHWWVAGISGGHASRGEAEERALAACWNQRAQRRMQAPCRLYAVGDEILPPAR